MSLEMFKMLNCKFCVIKIHAYQIFTIVIVIYNLQDIVVMETVKYSRKNMLICLTQLYELNILGLTNIMYNAIYIYYPKHLFSYFFMKVK